MPEQRNTRRWIERGVRELLRLRSRTNKSRVLLSLFLVLAVNAIVNVGLQSAEPKVNLEGYDFTFPAMGSSVTFSAYAASEKHISVAFGAARLEVERLAAMLTDYDSKSELSRLHECPKNADSHVSSPMSRELFEVICAAEDWHHRSRGSFDIAIGNLTRLWRNARKREEIPDQREIDEALSHSGWHLMRLDRETKRLHFSDSMVKLDLGGIAAGYIVDKAFDILVEQGLDRCLVNAGGDIRCGDPPPNRPGWKIEVASIRRGGPPVQRIFLSQASITTSGDLWQHTMIQGVLRSHILDPKTGLGVIGPMSVTLIAPRCIDADAGATAVCVMGKEAGFELVRNSPNFKSIWLNRMQNSEQIESELTTGFPEAIEEE
jgi:FAD:protein FMN transferase